MPVSVCYLPQGNYDDYCTHVKQLSFAEYIAYSQDYIRNIRQQAGLKFDDKTIQMNSPFELKPENYDGQNAVLLIHGFLASPYLMKAIGQFYTSQGYLVRAILLPGHGSSPGELTTAKLTHWIDIVNYGIEGLQKEAKNIHLCGFSLGGTLASLAAYQYPIASIVMLAPAHGITKTAALLPLLILLQKIPVFKFSWLVKLAQTDLVTYQSYPLIAVNEVRKAIILLNKKLNQAPLKAPCFIAASLDDSTVTPNNTIQFFHHHTHPKSRMLIYSGKTKSFNDKRIEVIVSKALERQIHDISHVAIPIAPEDTYYGQDGEFYGKLNDGIYFGEQTWRNLHNKNFRRLTYHPAFKTMLEAVDSFLMNVLNDD